MHGSNNVKSIFFLTAPASPPDMMTVADSSTSIVVIWYMVRDIDQNGIITMYEVRYEPLETFNDTITTMTETAQQRTVVLRNLQEYVDYNISVRAYTSEGEGPYSTEITERTLEDGNIGDTSFIHGSMYYIIPSIQNLPHPLLTLWRGLCRHRVLQSSGRR